MKNENKRDFLLFVHRNTLFYTKFTFVPCTLLQVHFTFYGLNFVNFNLVILSNVVIQRQLKLFVHFFMNQSLNNRMEGYFSPLQGTSISPSLFNKYLLLGHVTAL